MGKLLIGKGFRASALLMGNQRGAAPGATLPPPGLARAAAAAGPTGGRRRQRGVAPGSDPMQAFGGPDLAGGRGTMGPATRGRGVRVPVGSAGGGV